MTSSVVTASQSVEERTLTDIPSGSAVVYERVSCSAEASGYEGASYSYGTITPSTSVPSTSSEEADNEDSTLAPRIDVPAPVADQPNQ